VTAISVLSISIVINYVYVNVIYNYTPDLFGSNHHRKVISTKLLDILWIWKSEAGKNITQVLSTKPILNFAVH